MITATLDTFPLARAFTISRGSKTEARVITVTVTRNGITGHGESVPYARYGETPESVLAQIATLPEGITRAALQDALPPGPPATPSTVRSGIGRRRQQTPASGTSPACPPRAPASPPSPCRSTLPTPCALRRRTTPTARC
jgi:hypothetical protein